MLRLSVLTLLIQKGSGCVHNLNPISSLGNTEQISKEVGPYTISEVTAYSLASYSLRKGSDTDAKKKLEQFTGSSLPDVMNSTFGKISSFWIGPSQWLIEAPIEIHEDLASELSEVSMGKASITEQTYSESFIFHVQTFCLVRQRWILGAVTSECHDNR